MKGRKKIETRKGEEYEGVRRAAVEAEVAVAVTILLRGRVRGEHHRHGADEQSEHPRGRRLHERFSLPAPERGSPRRAGRPAGPGRPGNYPFPGRAHAGRRAHLHGDGIKPPAACGAWQG